MHYTQRGLQVSMIRRLKRQWWAAALGLLLLLATSGHGIEYVTSVPEPGGDLRRPHEVRSEIKIDYHGDVWREYYNKHGGATRQVKLGNINQPGGYHGPVPPGYQRPNQPRQPTRPPVTPPRPVVAPGTTMKIETFWRRQVRRIRNGRAYLDWETVKMVGYTYWYADGSYRGSSGVVAADDANMRRQGYRFVTANTSRIR